MKLNLLVLLASGVVAMGLLLGASTTQAQTEHLIAIYGLVLNSDAEAAFPVTSPVTPPVTPPSGGDGGSGCFIDTAGVGFFPSISSVVSSYSSYGDRSQ